ncbi:tetratricopeptide repeat protein [Pelagicoccus sp. SDUM812002]|uniref:tetratricopeptide repeat protein n=1 Tax=Pelagicoccus sp. SDUM812002 TaxID=3041266 RepID=UPI002812192B|nr:tetratricopeptide repeat protein [Pelagicoccus sp. SDUM812002]
MCSFFHAPAQEIEFRSLPELLREGSEALVKGNFPQAAHAFNAIQANYSEEPIWIEGQLPRKILPLAGLASHKANLQTEAIAALESYLASYTDSEDSEIFARYTLASSLLLDEQTEAAREAFSELRKLAGQSPFRDLASLREAELSESPRAIEILQEVVVDPASPRLASFARLRLIQLYLEEDDINNASIQLLDTNWHDDPLPELATLSFLASQTAEKLADQDPSAALRAYQLVSPKDQLVQVQKTRILKLQHQYRNLAPALKTEQSMWSDQFRQSIKQLQNQLERLREAPDYLYAIDLRKARCFAQSNRPLEAWILLQPIARSKHELAQAAHLEWISVARSMHAWDASAAIAKDFLSTYPDNQDIPQILLWIALSQVEQASFGEAISTLESLLAKDPPTDIATAAHYYLGFCYFNKRQTTTAIKAFETCKTLSPKSPVAAQAHLWIGICQFTTNELETAISTFHAIQGVSHARFLHPEAAFRETACHYALGALQPALQQSQQWLAAYQTHPRTAEVNLLQGDTFAELNQIEAAIEAYARVETEDLQLKFIALQKRCTLLLETEQTELALHALQTFRSDDPLLPAYIGSFTQLLAECLTHQEAQNEIAAAISEYGNDSDAIGIIELLHLLDAQPIASEEFPTLASRLIVTEIQTHRQNERYTEAKLKALELASNYDITDLPPAALAEAGNALSEISSLDASNYFHRILEEYPNSPDRDKAYIGLARFHTKRSKPAEGLAYLLQAENLDLETLTLKLKLENQLNQTANAQATAETILSERRAAPTHKAQALQTLAKIAKDNGKLNQAYAYYQRIFTLYRGETDYVATSYLSCIQILDSTNRSIEARRVAEEFIAQTDLSKHPAYLSAKRWHDSSVETASNPTEKQTSLE